MKPVDLWRHEARRAGLPALLGPPVLAVLILLLATFGARLGSREENTRWMLMGALEMGVPLLAGVAAATLPGRDPVAELRLAIPHGYRPALLRRLAVTLGCTAACAVVVCAALMASGWWTFAYGGAAGQLVWLAPALWLAALGFFAAAALRSTAAATSLVAFVWTGEQLFSGALADNPAYRLLHLFATTSYGSNDWPVNRLFLLATAVPLAFGGWLLLGNTERVLRGEPE
ncbi:hypothetical protein [Nonomuraea cavernae]|uniref:Uncharacterized protein n=1 Tax=Nonomuraea cavernae TaxID=2045107 RepID=A0A917Z0H3_9ACTN|nr:hypothetical protein [Nonomuraea cavernae]MCA2187765.1 hypothetical protein [Nonomuraea cavernae]GGO71786.1 hypothetical protein GCM10012289_38280 [Nonomuraea cavernae]